MRKTTVMAVAVMAISGMAAGSALAAGGPNEHANCNGQYSYSDAQNGVGLRGIVSHALKEIANEEGTNSGLRFHKGLFPPCS